MDGELNHLDCTLRDGGYYNAWDFSSALVNNYLDACSCAGINIVEIGFRFAENKSFKGACAYTSETYLNSLIIPNGLMIGIMLNAADIVTDNKLDDKKLMKLVPLCAADSRLDVVRIASHFNEFQSTLEACEILKNRGYKVGANLMQISECSEADIAECGRLLSTANLDVFYFADSLGSLRPDDITWIMEQIRSFWTGDVGIHAHDNMSLALANSLRALDLGVNWIDSTITGMGRGPGNVRTEELALELYSRQGQSQNFLPLLELVHKEFGPMKAKYKWGTNPYYYLAGQNSIHPTYIQDMLSDVSYNESDILAVIENLKINQSAKFDKDNFARARNFFVSEREGLWSPDSIIPDGVALLVAGGENTLKHERAIIDFIKKDRPVVVALNAINALDPELINYRIACNPTRMLADIKKYSELPHPLIAPLTNLPSEMQRKLENNVVLDYGIRLREGQLEIRDRMCTVPNTNVMTYAISTLVCGGAKDIMLAGFDGYPYGSRKNAEFDVALQLVQSHYEINLCSITPTTHNLRTQSVYQLI